MIKLGLIAGLLVALLVLLGGCLPQDQQQSQGGFDWTIIVFLVLIFAVFYFLMIRPQRKRQQKHQEMLSQLQRGDQVITAGGIFGVIESIDEESVVIKVESGATLRVARSSVVVKRER